MGVFDAYIIDVELKDKTLLFNLSIRNSLNKPIKETFYFVLSSPMVVTEINSILFLTKATIYFLLKVDKYLLRIGSQEFIINNQIRNKIVDCLEQYLQDYGDYCIEEIDNKKNFLSFDKYNWVDAVEFLQVNALKFEYIEPWFEDAWNILMFDGAVSSNKTVVSEYFSDFKKADIIIWLLTLYDIFFDYQTLIKDEQVDKKGKGKNLLNFLNVFCKYKWEELISKYLYKSIMCKLNVCLITGCKSKYNIYTNEKEYFYFYYENEDDYSVPYEVLIEEISRRRNIFIDKIYNYFENNEDEIVVFMTGNHWRENYTNYYDRIINAEKEFNKYLKIINDMSEIPDDFYYSFEGLLDELNEEYPVSVNDIGDEILNVHLGRNYSINAKLHSVFMWIMLRHMQALQ